jgi:hypothetical protein
MAGKVFFSVSMSLDGFIAPESMEGFIVSEERRDDPDVQRWMAQWMELQQWIFPQRFFLENLKLGEAETSASRVASPPFRKETQRPRL